MIGVPNAPYATGAVLAISDRAEACRGLKPNCIKIAAVIATGVPNPAAPSKKAPNENAIKISCTRLSGTNAANCCRSTSKEPFLTVSWYRKIKFKMIQPMGNKPYAAP